MPTTGPSAVLEWGPLPQPATKVPIVHTIFPSTPSFNDPGPNHLSMRNKTTRLRTERRTRDTTRREASLSPNMALAAQDSRQKDTASHRHLPQPALQLPLCCLTLSWQKACLHQSPSHTQPTANAEGWSGRLCKQTGKHESQRTTLTQSLQPPGTLGIIPSANWEENAASPKAAFLCRELSAEVGRCAELGYLEGKCAGIRCKALARGGAVSA